ncbi:hypothetical protein [uncultured Maricaulis sp.]|uniref:hypothetical protein n=1 Tax=uncultured Maricaulis sp. TaxID=174710 RepID=UPI0030DB056D|tara:strand:+ start:14807 stop:15037 length:231 start_codon:yes stop_codon:yes gene_type:complete
MSNTKKNDPRPILCLGGSLDKQTADGSRPYFADEAGGTYRRHRIGCGERGDVEFFVHSEYDFHAAITNLLNQYAAS